MKIKILFLPTLLISSLLSAAFNVDSTAQFRQALEDAAMNGENDTIILAPDRSSYGVWSKSRKQCTANKYKCKWNYESVYSY